MRSIQAIDDLYKDDMQDILDQDLLMQKQIINDLNSLEKFNLSSNLEEIKGVCNNHINNAFSSLLTLLLMYGVACIVGFGFMMFLIIK
jgi:hypothetical protein